MKKLALSLLAIFTLSLLFAFHALHSGGEAGATGSPGEGTCANCHGGGPSVTTVSISAIPSFTNNSFDPLTNYTITVTVSNPSLSTFGFDCEILDATNTSIGTMTNAATGVQLVNAFNGRRNATHTAKKNGSGSASFTFEWNSPEFGNATFYVAGNAVNSNGNTGGDMVGTAVLTVTNINTALEEKGTGSLSGMSVFPNPATDLISVSYYLPSAQKIVVELLEINGRLVKTLVCEEQAAGPHSNIIDLKGVGKGVYFVKTSVNGNKVTQKLISVQ